MEIDMLRMLVLAGGFGSRLQSTVTNVPKALAPVGSFPFLALQIKHWINQGVQSFVFLLHHQADLVVSFLEEEKLGLLKDCKVEYVVEPTPMGTGGAVAHAVKQLNLTGNFLLTNADTWIGNGIQDVASSKAPSIAVLSLSDTGRYGRVLLNEQLQITSFSEKSLDKGPGWINAGLCYLKASLFEGWNGQPFSLEQDFLSELASYGDLTAVVLQTDFIDIGIPEDYFRFCNWMTSDDKGILCN